MSIVYNDCVMFVMSHQSATIASAQGGINWMYTSAEGQVTRGRCQNRDVYTMKGARMKSQRKKSRVITCRLEPGQERKLVAYAALKGVKVSAALRDLVETAPDPLTPGTRRRGQKSEETGTNLGGSPVSHVRG